MSSVLILGNGISRLLYEDMIKSWSGELWACNYAYLEWGHKLTRLTGHTDVIMKAANYREKNHHSFDIWTGNLGASRLNAQYVKHFTCPMELRKDSGTTLVAQALTEHFDEILICGYDLGGRDVYSRMNHKRSKSSWVKRWGQLRHIFPLQFEKSIKFVGYDHKPLIMRKTDTTLYGRRYMRGLPHIPDPAYIALFNLLYGQASYSRRIEPMVKVRYLKGAKCGWERPYPDAIANRLAARGEVEILGPFEETSEELEIAAATEITKNMKKSTLVKIAKIRGYDGAEKLTKAGIVKLFESTELKGEGRIDYEGEVIE